MSAVADPSSSLRDATALARQGRFDEAERLAQARLAAAPDDAETVQLLGGIARARGDRARAVQLYSAMVYAGPGLVSAVRRDLDARLAADGFATLADAIGAAHG